MRMLKIFLILLLSALVAISGYKIYKEVTTQQKEIEKFDELQEIVEEIPDNTETKNEAISTEEPVEIIEKSRNLAPLFERNSDCIGWICIPETNINYPVMHTPSNPQRYLRKNFDKEYSNAGIPFLDGNNTLDGDNLIIYGHNMRNGTMFSDLTQYRNEDYCIEHPVIEFETARGLKLYTVFAVVYVKNEDSWYDFYAADDETDYKNKIDEIKRRALYDTGITPEYGQQLLTLSTCYGATKNDRIIVIGAESTY